MGPLADPPPPKGILRPSSLGAPRGDASSTPRGDDDPPTMPGRADAAVTTTFDAFHDRVGAVFANLGPGLRDAPAPPAWMPSNTSVVRAGRPVAPPRDDDARDVRDDDDAEEATFSSDDDDADAAAPRDPSERSSSAAAPSSPPVDLGDLDCLGSDVEAEPGDDSEAMRRMRRSVGRCDALDAEEEYDRFDDVALGGGRDAFADASDAAAAVRTSPPNAKAAGSAGSAERFEDALRRRSANKRRRAETSRGVAWAASVPGDDAPGRPGRGAFGGGGGDAKKNPGAGALLSSSASWVPDHVRHPDRYTCYTLDEPLLIGGGGRSTGGASLKGARRKAAEAVSVKSSGSGSGPGSVAAEAAAEAEAAPLERPIFSAAPRRSRGAAAAGGGRGFFLRRRVVRGGGGEGRGRRRARGAGLSFDAAADDDGGRRRGGGGRPGRGPRRRAGRGGVGEATGRVRSRARGGRGRAEERAEAARGRGRGRVRGGDACSHRWTDAPGALFESQSSRVQSPTALTRSSSS